VVTLAFEMGFVVVMIFVPHGRLIALVSAVAFHVATKFLISIGFENLWYTYLAFVDVAAITRWLQARLGLSLVAVSSGARSSGHSLRALVVATVVLVGGNVAFGAARVMNGWPFVCFPNFAVLQTPLFTGFAVLAQSATGEPIYLHDTQLGRAAFNRELYNVLRSEEEHQPGLQGAEGRESRFGAVCTYLMGHEPALRGATDVRFALEDRDLSPQRGDDTLIERRVLFRCVPPRPRQAGG
jgi:hypothetical protein